MEPDKLDAIFGALADPTRRAILARLASGEVTVNDLAAPFAMSQPAVSKHLKVLERAGLIARGRDAQRRPCRLHPETLKAVADWVARFALERVSNGAGHPSPLPAREAGL
jgi:DNA-binding transcriptional ArsR family regulator